MGTSSTFYGQPGSTPLVPSWLGDENSTAEVPDGTESDQQPPASTPVPPIADPTRFSAARNNFPRFASSGGTDRRSLGRVVSHYVGSSTGGTRTAAVRMGSSRRTGARLLGILSDVAARGAGARHVIIGRYGANDRGRLLPGILADVAAERLGRPLFCVEPLPGFTSQFSGNAELLRSGRARPVSP